MLREHRIRTTTAVATAAVLLLAGCSGTIGATPTPTPTPTWTCTPDDSGDPCTAAKAAAQAEQAEAYAEAEHAYREFTKERTRILREGGSPTPSPVLVQYGTAEYLEAMQSDLSTAYENGFSITGSVVVTALQIDSYDSSRLTFFACEDASDVVVFDANGNRIGQGEAAAQLIVAESIAGTWKIADAELTEGTSCAASS